MDELFVNYTALKIIRTMNARLSSAWFRSGCDQGELTLPGYGNCPEGGLTGAQSLHDPKASSGLRNAVYQSHL